MEATNYYTSAGYRQNNRNKYLLFAELSTEICLLMIVRKFTRYHPPLNWIQECVYSTSAGRPHGDRENPYFKQTLKKKTILRGNLNFISWTKFVECQQCPQPVVETDCIVYIISFYINGFAYTYGNQPEILLFWMDVAVK